MTSHQLFQNIQRKKSFLCIGLDSELQKIPGHLKDMDDPILAFNKSIIDATHPYVVAYKPNVAFYESRGAEGWETLEKTLAYIRETDPGVFVIADAKRGDIGNTARMYANTFFQTMDFDAVTVAPYMGHDSIQPFLDYPGKWVVLLALTSNKGADDFQFIEEKASGKRLFEIILEKSGAWASVDQMMYVAGATRAEMLADIRRYIPDHFLLVPGIGAQGGSLEEVCRFGMNRHCGLLVNSSRGIIYADPGLQFAMRAAEKARELQEQMETILEQRGLL